MRSQGVRGEEDGRGRENRGGEGIFLFLHCLFKGIGEREGKGIGGRGEGKGMRG